MDDVISTGGSLHAMEELVKMAGGTVVGRIAVLAEGGAADRKDIKYLKSPCRCSTPTAASSEHT